MSHWKYLIGNISMETSQWKCCFEKNKSMQHYMQTKSTHLDWCMLSILYTFNSVYLQFCILSILYVVNNQPATRAEQP